MSTSHKLEITWDEEQHESIAQRVAELLRDDLREQVAGIASGTRMLSSKKASDLLGVSKPTFWRLTKLADFPRARRYGGKGEPRWPEDEILQFAREAPSELTAPAQRKMIV